MIKMRKINIDWRDVLLVAAIIIFIVFCVVFYNTFQAVEDAQVREKAWEKQQDVNLLFDIIDRITESENISNYAREELLHYAVQYIEANYYSTFAQLYDGELNPLFELHAGVGGGRKHNPLDYPEFIEAVCANESGSLVYWYETPEVGGRYVHMYYRWTSSDLPGMNRYLAAVGVSKYTIKETMDATVIYEVVALAAVLILFVLLVTGFIGTKNDDRKRQVANEVE